MKNSPVQQLVLKIHNRCDLACDHCYVFKHADQSWSTRPSVISDEALGQVARRLAAHAEQERLDAVAVILHGGEPLLAGAARLRRICEQLTETITPVTSLDLRIHTNGVQLNRHHLEIFDEYQVKVGISLDGDRAANDRHRLDRKGRSSYDRVLRAVELLRTEEFRHLYLGLLCTVDVANDPVAVHDALTALDPPRIDYLLPHSTWDNPPPRPPGSPTPYADWLLRIFDRWEEQGRNVPVRTFDSVLSTLRGGPSQTEALGLAPSDLAVVETDGTFEQADSLKIAYHGAPATGYDVFRHTFEDFGRHPGVRARRLGIEGVSDTCKRCPVVESCGGGLYAHRYSTERGFDAPSVFCADLRALIDGIAERITQRSLSPVVRHAGELRFAQTDLNRTLLARLHEHPAGNADLAAAWRALVALDAGENTAPGLEEVLDHPYTRTALLRSLEGNAGVAARSAAMAAAAAVRARGGPVVSWDCETADLHLPTLGTLRLPRPCRVEITATADGFRARDPRGGAVLAHVRLGAAGNPPEWRPLTTLDDAGGPLLVDDADPCRTCYPAAVSPPLEPGDLRLFRKRCQEARSLLDLRAPGWRDDPALVAATTFTPLVAGAGVGLGAHGMGALGVAVDIAPEELAAGLLRTGRRARLVALREAADLHVPGSAAGRLLDEVSAWLGEAAVLGSLGEPTHRACPRDREERRAGGGARRRADALERAFGALRELDSLPGRELTESGAELAAQWRAEVEGAACLR